ncbi:MAG: protoheme IX farnesyltransferase [Bacteroidales bacterium]|nr:protoheme IX farnesyltransferase [Bacteroidales bacterium]
MQRFKAFVLLGKPFITIAVSISALSGYLLYSGEFSKGWLPLFTGIFLLAYSSACLNQLQERTIDARMARTRKRPLPSGKLTPSEALAAILITAPAGALLLWLAGDLPALALGLSNLILYNLLYTRLKPHTLFAVLPGSLVGAIPPVIGWISAGGPIPHLHILMVAMFFFIGQIPHTWLILLRYNDEYEDAGFISLGKLFNRQQINALTFTWVTCTAIAAVMLSIAGVFFLKTTSIINMILALALLVYFGTWLRNDRHKAIGQAFTVLNMVYLCVMMMLIIDSLARHDFTVY